jgi:hypothetical protein
MKLIPDSKWANPAKSWDDLIERYTAFLQVPAWRGRTHKTDGTQVQNCLRPEQAERLRKRLAQKIDLLSAHSTTSLLPYLLLQSTVEAFVAMASLADRSFGKCPRWLWHLLRALILNRDGYRCHYCGRNAWEAMRELSATLRFELDHKKAKSRLGVRDELDVSNIVTACRCCNVIKGQTEEGRFLTEVDSLARAVLKNSKLGRGK